jgi:hypothetical protein
MLSNQSKAFRWRLIIVSLIYGLWLNQNYINDKTIKKKKCIGECFDDDELGLQRDLDRGMTSSEL